MTIYNLQRSHVKKNIGLLPNLHETSTPRIKR